MSICTSIKENGERCKVSAKKGSELCFFHSEDEGDLELRMEKSVKGGLNRRQYQDDPTADISDMVLDSPDDCASVLQLVIT